MRFDEAAARRMISAVADDHHRQLSAEDWVLVPNRLTPEWLERIRAKHPGVDLPLPELVDIVDLILRCAPEPQPAQRQSTDGMRWVPRWVTAKWVQSVNAPHVDVSEIISSLLRCAPDFPSDDA